MSTSKAGTADDADLEDLLSNQESTNISKPSSQQSNKLPSTNVCVLCSSYLSYVCLTSPKICTCLTFLGIGLFFFIIVNFVFNPFEVFGKIDNDYSNIQSEYDLSMSKIDHWCLKGDNNSCRCEDPLVPLGRQQFKSWVQAHHLNKEDITNYLSDHEYKSPDVVFVGESLIEEMDGRWMGRTTETLQKIGKIFNKHFIKGTKGSKIDGLALGIAGDTSPNVLWRLIHGEMPPDFNPKVWWISLGMNDLGRMQCSEEVVVIGILRIVEEIRKQKPNAKIVINSMLPMADLRGGLMPLKKDYLDAFTKYKGQPRKGGKFSGKVVDPSRVARPNSNQGRGGGNNNRSGGGGGRLLGLARRAGDTDGRRRRLDVTNKNPFAKKLSSSGSSSTTTGDVTRTKKNPFNRIGDGNRRGGGGGSGLGSLLQKQQAQHQQQQEHEEEIRDLRRNNKPSPIQGDVVDDQSRRHLDSVTRTKNNPFSRIGNSNRRGGGGGLGALLQKHHQQEQESSRDLRRNKPSPNLDEDVVDAKPKNYKGNPLRERSDNNANNDNNKKTKKQSPQLNKKEQQQQDKRKKILNKKEQKELIKKIKRDRYNPTIKSNQGRIKKYDAKKLFMKQNKIPLWTSIHSINDELKKFASKHDAVQFFDSTSIFAERTEGDKYVLLSDMISARGHPTEDGYKMWEKAVYDKVVKMVEKEIQQEQEDQRAKQQQQEQAAAANAEQEDDEEDKEEDEE